MSGPVAEPKLEIDTPPEVAEVNSARQVFRDLDKACRATRTYGTSNAVTKRFFDQLQTSMLGHLEQWPVLAVIVDRAELRMHEEAVYKSEDSVGESLAFRLFGDGVREVRFEHGLSPEDLQSFLDALWGPQGTDDESDDDVVTRLWDKDLATVSFLTAEDIVQAPSSPDLAPQEHGYFAAPPASFGPLLDQEKSRAAHAGMHNGKGPPAAGDNLGSGGLVGFEVEEFERQAMLHELEGERGADNVSSVLAMLKVMLECEPSPDILSRALGVAPGMLDALLVDANWPAVLDVLGILQGAGENNPEFAPTDRILAQRVVQSLSLPDRVALMEKGLALDPPKPLDGLAELLSRLEPPAVPALCGVLAGVSADEPRRLLRETLIRLGRNNPEPVLKGLADPRPQYARDLIEVIAAWQRPQASEELAMVAAHPAPEVREAALEAIARLHTSGDGAPILAFASDAQEVVRLHALRLLASARYTGSWEGWKQHLADREAMVELPRAEKRMLFQALRVTAGDGVVPFWRELLGGHGWKQRAKKEEAALLAVKSLAALGTPAARAALEFGKAEGSSHVRKACTAELAKADEPPKGSG